MIFKGNKNIHVLLQLTILHQKFYSKLNIFKGLIKNYNQENTFYIKLKINIKAEKQIINTIKEV